MRSQSRSLPSHLLLLLMGMLFILSACNLGAPAQQEATLTSPPDGITVQPTTTAQVQGGVTVFPTITPFVFSTRPISPPTSIVLVPNNPPPPTNTPAPISIVIVAPLPGNIISGTVQVVGSASHPNFLQYRLEYAPQNNPNNQWFPITGIVQQPVVAGVLGVWSTNTGTTPDGIYQVRLRVFLRDGTVQTTQVGNVRVQNQQPTPVPTNTTIPRPIAAFTQNITTGAAPLVVNFSNQSQGQITSYSWSFGEGGSSSAVNPTYTYRQPGTYTVTLRVTGPGGTSNVSRQITVNSPASPVAAFTPSVVSGEPPLTVSFTNQSTGQISSIEWDFGDGTTSTEQNPTHVFNDAQTYNVVLRVAGPGGSSSQIRAITVEDTSIPAPVAAFTPSETDIETGNNITFNNETTGEATAFLWDFDGDGLTDNTDISPTHIYNTAGEYDVRLTAIGIGGQTDAVVRVVVSNPPDAPDASFDFAVDGNIAPVTVNFNDTTQGDVTEWLWDFGNDTTSTQQNPTITYDIPGTYFVTLTATGPGGSTTTQDVAINVETPFEAPTAAFSANPESGTAELTVEFANESTGTQLSYAWNFGDNNSSTDENPTHTYTAIGNYDVTLTVTDPQGQTDSETFTVIVSEEVAQVPEPSASFNVTTNPLVAGQPINFQNTSLNASIYTWDFGDNSGTSNDVNPTHTYAAAGQYTVSLTAEGEGGTNTNSILITVDPAPVVIPEPSANFNILTSPIVAGQPVSFENTSQNATSYTWAFGDGGTSNEVSPSYTYVAAGQFTVSLTATGDGGTNTIEVPITVDPAPVVIPEPSANFNILTSPIVAGQPVSFENTSQNATSYTWAFGDGGTSNEVSPSYTYVAAGPYTVTLTATGDGGTQSTEVAITVEAPAPAAPVPSFNVLTAPIVAGQPVSFENTSQNATSYTWAFGDGGTSNEVSPSYTYAAAGPYTVTLTATGDGGTQSTEVGINVEAAPAPAPIPSFNVLTDPIIAGQPVSFENTSQNATSYTWAFGDGGTSNEASPSYTYAAAGPYTVSLTATGDGGTQSTEIGINVQGGGPPQVQSPTGPLLFISNTTGNLEIFVADANGQNPVNITETAADEVEPAWSPDGTKIAYAYFNNGDYDIFVFDLDSMTTTQITNNVANDRQPAWSHDGTRLAFASDRNNLNVNNDVFVVDVSNLNRGNFNPTVLLSTPSDEQEPSWSSDSSQIAFMSDAAGAGTNNIYVVSVADTSAPTQITLSPATANTSNEPEWSSNNVIAFSADPDASGNREIFRINPDGSGEVRLTTNGFNDRIPKWSTDNNQIYYTSNQATDGSGNVADLSVYVMNAADGSGPTPVTGGGSDEANADTR